ncbi:hypothetical protein [Salipaludibacillus aurantiacus]|uniref:Uncharacterized protein n=1 Tax=Salipaludibacillus aurantiacus TaxID=1601833 RepID=A0A1H9RTR0_9BACI|nr:hypothetical protein [Salipaludibacillus aurantiacus]SER75513.1 hypothetical protein SAMN05518684_103304 [Salipaludibacillus aurantiacus]
MDIFTVPDPSDSGMGYAYIIMIFVFIAASFTVYKLKKSAQKNKKQEVPKAYEMYEAEDKKQ